MSRFSLGSDEYDAGRVHLSSSCQLLVHRQYLFVSYQSNDPYYDHFVQK